VLLDDLLKILREVVLGAANDTKVGCSLLRESNRDLKFFEFFMVSGVLHFFQNNAFFHLTDILLLYNSHKVFESSINFVRVNLFIILTDAL